MNNKIELNWIELLQICWFRTGGQPRPGQAELALWPRLPRFFYPLVNMAKARPQAGLNSAFRPGFDPGLLRSGRVPDPRVVDDNTESGNDTLVNILWNLLVVTKKIRYIPEGFKHWIRLTKPKCPSAALCYKFGEGAFEFSVFRFWPFLRWFFGFCTEKLRFCGFVVRCGQKILSGFSVFYSPQLPPLWGIPQKLT